MKGRLWADAELPDNIGGQTLSLTFTQLSDRTGRFDAPLLGSVRSIFPVGISRPHCFPWS